MLGPLSKHILILLPVTVTSIVTVTLTLTVTCHQETRLLLIRSHTKWLPSCLPLGNYIGRPYENHLVVAVVLVATFGRLRAVPIRFRGFARGLGILIELRPRRTLSHMLSHYHGALRCAMRSSW